MHWLGRMARKAAAVACLAALAGSVHAGPTALFWFDSHPGMPTHEAWKPGEKMPTVLEEMVYSQMHSRPGSPEHFRILKREGFGGVGLPGFDGPYDGLGAEEVTEEAKKPDHQHLAADKPFNPDDDAPANLDPVHQTRNALYYCKWAKDAGLEVYLLSQFWGRGHASDRFNWGDEQWTRVTDYVRRMARFGRRHQCTGLIFDFEPYSDYRRMWQLSLCMEQQKLGRAEALQLVRNRARGFGEAIAREWPQCALQVYGMGSYDPKAEDGQDVWRAFFAGLCDAGLVNGVHSNELRSYYCSDEVRLKWAYEAGMADLASVKPLLRDPAYLNRCSLSLGTAFLNRWYSGDAMYWRPTSRYTALEVRNIVIWLRKFCPRYFWFVGNWTYDWIEPGRADEMRDVDGLWGLGMPFRNLAERTTTLMRAFTEAMRIPDAQIPAAYEKMKADLPGALRQAAARRDPRLLDKRMGILFNKYVEMGESLDDDARQGHVWKIERYSEGDFERLTRDLPHLDVVASSFATFDRPQIDMSQHGREWREFLERGGALSIADASTNPAYEAWLKSIAPELALPADFVPVPGFPWVRRTKIEPTELAQGPNRIELATWDKAWRSVPEGWTVAARTPEGLPVYVYRRFGKGVVSVLVCCEQLGYGWPHLENLALLARP